MKERLKLDWKKSLPIWITGFLLILFIAIVDYFTGYQLSFSIFYLIPIIWITWKSGKIGGILYSVFSSIAWLAADLLTSPFYAHTFIPYWNATMRLAMFILVAVLLSALKKSLDKERQNSRTDHLTQLSNSKSFMEALELEFQRSKRYEHHFSLAYIDVDNFKAINDTMGHHTGDQLLQNIATSIRETTRQTDIIGRMGGDEFCILLPETDQKKAMDVLRRVNDKLTTLTVGKNNKITLSIGCVTYQTVPDSIDEVIKMADDLMYEAKQKGKNKIRQAIYDKSFE